MFVFIVYVIPWIRIWGGVWKNLFPTFRSEDPGLVVLNTVIHEEYEIFGTTGIPY